MKSKKAMEKFRKYIVDKPEDYKETLQEAIGLAKVDNSIGNVFF
jgi:hypothetical protein|tara:strand:- start:795 stop:926 length:132 start_codon:yes stop_codon:yes gene_type:complete